MKILFILLSLFPVICTSCTNEKIPGGRIVIRNDILDKEFNSFYVDQVISAQGMMPYRKSLLPGEQITLPYKSIRNLRFVRQYADHAKVYMVTCPSDLDTEIVMKLIDVHTNRLSGGCVLTRKGGMNAGGMVKWEMSHK